MTVRLQAGPRSSLRPGRRVVACLMVMVGVAGGAGVAACGGTYPGVAAMVNGKVISDSDLDAIAQDLQPYVPPGQRLQPALILNSLISRPFVVDRLKATNRMVSTEEAAPALQQMLSAGRSIQGAPSPQQWATPTKELAQAAVGSERLSSADQQRVTVALKKADIVVNPKYGEFQMPRGVTSSVPNWIDAAGGPAASSDGQGGQQQAPAPTPQPQQSSSTR